MEISENLCQDVAGGTSSGDDVPEWNYRICGGYSESHGRLFCHSIADISSNDNVGFFKFF